MLPHVQREKNRRRRKKLLMKRQEEERMARRQTTAVEAPTVSVSQTQQKKLDRKAECDAKKATHKLAWMDRLWGTGRGPVGLRMKWMDKLLGG